MHVIGSESAVGGTIETEFGQVFAYADYALVGDSRHLLPMVIHIEASESDSIKYSLRVSEDVQLIRIDDISIAAPEGSIILYRSKDRSFQVLTESFWTMDDVRDESTAQSFVLGVVKAHLEFLKGNRRSPSADPDQH